MITFGEMIYYSIGWLVIAVLCILWQFERFGSETDKDRR